MASDTTKIHKHPDGKWTVVIPGNRGTTILAIDGGTGEVRDTSGAAVTMSDCSIAVGTLQAVGTGESHAAANRVNAWARRHDFRRS